MSAVLLRFPGHFRHAVWHDLESFIHSLHWMTLRFHETNKRRLDTLKACVDFYYSTSYVREDGTAFGGEFKLDMLKAGTMPFELVGGSVGKPAGLHSLLVVLSHLYQEHYAWLAAELKLPFIPLESLLGSSVTQGKPRRHEVLGVTVENTDSEDDEDDTLPDHPPPSKKPEPVLDYRRVKLAFKRALRGTWTYDAKSDTDRFAQFEY